MKHSSDFKKTIKFLLFLIAAAACTDTHQENPSGNKTKLEGHRLTVGIISNHIQNDVSIYQPFIEYLQRSLTIVGVSEIDLAAATDVHEMIDLMNDDKVQIFFDSPFPAKEVLESTDFELFLKQTKAGVQNYQSLVFANYNSNINSLDDLKGKVIGFENKFSTTGFYLPFRELTDLGYKLRQVDSLKESINQDEIGYYFTGDDENTFFWVLRKKLIAGATDNISLDQYSANRIDTFNVLFKSKDYPRYLMMIKSSVHEEIKDKLKNVLLSIHENPAGKEILSEFYGTTQFVELFPEDIEKIKSL